ncbi:hypothetical protein K402DRAFT_466480 [Aulographum hederae CBS 113979]|uniref:Uncharacterized protein n=1 Tax=Aulographum hederae CBS 113979 TaxID=1176131 RepID=A0A6G1GPY0_9PEZI|nr:hypothetical protein K402DRAFT_466480 [Aulographum hederae CBS 113979]
MVNWIKKILNKLGVGRRDSRESHEYTNPSHLSSHPPQRHFGRGGVGNRTFNSSSQPPLSFFAPHAPQNSPDTSPPPIPTQPPHRPPNPTPNSAFPAGEAQPVHLHTTDTTVGAPASHEDERQLRQNRQSRPREVYMGVEQYPQFEYTSRDDSPSPEGAMWPLPRANGPVGQQGVRRSWGEDGDEGDGGSAGVGASK